MIFSFKMHHMQYLFTGVLNAEHEKYLGKRLTDVIKTLEMSWKFRWVVLTHAEQHNSRVESIWRILHNFLEAYIFVCYLIKLHKYKNTTFYFYFFSKMKYKNYSSNLVHL